MTEKPGLLATDERKATSPASLCLYISFFLFSFAALFFLTLEGWMPGLVIFAGFHLFFGYLLFGLINIDRIRKWILLLINGLFIFVIVAAVLTCVPPEHYMQ